jgi:hypothetical protein
LEDEYTASVYKFFGLESYGSKFLWRETFCCDRDRLLDINAFIPLPEKISIKLLIKPDFADHRYDEAMLRGLGLTGF